MRCGVLALGNVLMGDDALGPFVLAQLHARYQFPAAVTLLDLGTPGLTLGTHFEPWDRLILVDALRAVRAPGRVVVLRGAAAIAGLPRSRSGAHESGLDQALLTCGLQAGRCPETVLIGAVAWRVEMGAALSPLLRRAADRVAALVVRQLTLWGVAPTQRDHPGPPAIWWEPQPAQETRCTR